MINGRLFLVSLVLMLGACAAQAPVPEDRFYQLELAGPATTVGEPLLRGGLKVDAVAADPLRSGRAVLYRDTRKPLELQRYHYEFWVDQPPRIVQQALANYLHQSGVVDFVDGANHRSRADYTLETRLQRFEQVIDGDRARVEVELDARLYSNGTGSILWANVYRQRQDSRDRYMHAAAEAMQVALAQIFDSLLADIGATDPDPR